MRARDNPFATTRIHQIRYRLRGLNWDELLQRLDKMNFRAAIVGPEGSGKTTLLEDLAPRLRERDWAVIPLQLTRESRQFDKAFLSDLLRTLTPRHVMLLDGAEQMGRLRWRWFRWSVRRAGGLIVTSHRSGLLPTLLRCKTDPELLRQILGELVDLKADAVFRRTEELFAVHRGNLRDAFRALYDEWAVRPESALLA